MDQYGIFGNPIQHSWSPKVHQLFAEQTNQQLTYQPFLVPLESFSQALTDFQIKNGKGLNITMPFKQQAYQAVNQLSGRAKLAQSVNTIQFNPDGSRFGDNTDGIGFIRDVTQRLQFSLLNKRILILGAGGAVRGILAPILQELPDSVVIANRTLENADALASAFNHKSIQACCFADLTKFKFDLLINATSASLGGETIDLPKSIVSENSCCYDMVYGKGRTPFMSWAEKNHAGQISDGLGMLIEQAAESFHIWRGVRPETLPVINYFILSE